MQRDMCLSQAICSAQGSRGVDSNRYFLYLYTHINVLNKLPSKLVEQHMWGLQHVIGVVLSNFK